MPKAQLFTVINLRVMMVHINLSSELNNLLLTKVKFAGGGVSTRLEVGVLFVFQLGSKAGLGSA